MCGLVGAVGGLYASHIKYFNQALISDYFRGRHSTGVAFASSREVFVKKLAIDPINFLNLKDVDTKLNPSQLAVMGHNRHATMGGINSANAHPFTHGNITLMHNGTLTNKSNLQQSNDMPYFDTDSELVCAMLDDFTMESTVKACQGAFAFTWWDSSDETFNFIRNNERPFCFAFGKNAVLYASERKMLEWLIDRNTQLTLDSFNIVEPEAGMYFKIKPNATGYEVLEERKVELHTPKPRSYSYTPQNDYYPHSNTFDNNGNKQIGYKPPKEDKVSSITNTQRSNIETFNKRMGINLEVDEYIFLYLDDMDEDKYKGSDYCDMHFTMAETAYADIPVIAYHVSKADLPKGIADSEIWCFKIPVRSASFTSKKPTLIVGNKPEKWDYLDDSQSSEQMALFNEWNAVVGMESGPDSPTTYQGYDGTKLSQKAFEDLLHNECCAVCGAVPDTRTEVDEQQSVVFISHKEHICVDCVDVYNKEFNLGNAPVKRIERCN